MIDTNFCFKKDMKNLKFRKGILKKDVKGYLLNDTAFVNLSAIQWKGLNEDILIPAITNTITHEVVHSFQKGIKHNVEERICGLMADQLEVKDERKT